MPVCRRPVPDVQALLRLEGMDVVYNKRQRGCRGRIQGDRLRRQRRQRIRHDEIRIRRTPRAARAGDGIERPHADIGGHSGRTARSRQV